MNFVPEISKSGNIFYVTDLQRLQIVRMSELDQGKETLKEDKRFIEELDVVKKGYLHIKRPPTNIKLRIKVFFNVSSEF